MENKVKYWPIFKKDDETTENKFETETDVNFNEDGNIIIGGADVVGLYPACTAKHSGLVAKKVILKSSMKFEGVNYREAARYCAMMYDKFEIRANGIERVVPIRRHKKGSKPGVTGCGPMSKHKNDEELWLFPNMEPTELEKRRLLACCTEIGIRKAFSSHLYKFAGRTFLQLDGGPIGVRLAGAVARVVMGEWDLALSNIMKANKMLIWLICRYVDDVTVLMTALRKGTRWDKKQQRLAYCKQWEAMDRREGLPDSTRTMMVVKDIMNSIFRNIQVTTEVPENFQDRKLPVLDFKCWVEGTVGLNTTPDTEQAPDNHKVTTDQVGIKKVPTGNGGIKGTKGDGGIKRSRKIYYTFFEKEMASKFAIMKASALPEKTKVNSLSNDLIRRMKNTSEMLAQKTRDLVVDSFTERLLLSGYRTEQVRDITIAGLSGYERVVKLEAENKGKIHRSATSTSANRYKKKLVGKSTWFLGNRKCDDPEEAQLPDINKESRQNSKPGNHGQNTTKQRQNEDQKTLTVLFVMQTPNGELAKRLRQAEQELSEICGNKVKIVERSGVSLKSILVKTNPLPEQKCGRMNCFPCQQEDNSRCKVRSITYQTSCLLCKQQGVDKRYIGESARSAFERGVEHLKGYETKSIENHMHKHHQIDHQEELSPPEFSMKVIKSHQSPLYRQIHEAIMILKHESVVLNSRGEYNRCQLPRLSVMMGEREVVKKKEEDAEEVSEDLDTDAKRKENPCMIIQRQKRRKIDRPSSSSKTLPTMMTMTSVTPKRKRLTEDENKMNNNSKKKPRKQEADLQLKCSVQKNLLSQTAPSSTPACLSVDIFSNSRSKNQTGAKKLIDLFENFGKQKKNATQPNKVAQLKENFENHPTLHNPPQGQKETTDPNQKNSKTRPTLLPPPQLGTKKRPTKIPAKTSTYRRQVQLKISEFLEKVKPEDRGGS